MSQPDVSVVIPVYNDPAGVRDTLSTLFRQSLDASDYELIVADNGSTDRTPDLVRSLLRSFDGNARLVHEHRLQSSYAARNRGIQASEAPLIAFIDADMTVGNNWLEQIRDRFSSEDVDYLACNVQLTTDADRPSAAARFNQKMMGFPVKEALEDHRYAPTACIAVRRSVFHELGRFDERLISGGDQEFGDRVHRAGFNVRYAPEIRMKHPARTSIASLARKFFRVGRGKQLLCRRYRERFSDHCRNPFNARFLLPPSPSRFVGTLNSRSLSNADGPTKLIFYFLCWIRKLFTHAGYLYSLGSKTPSPRPPSG